MKVILFALAFIVVALSGTVSIASAETVPSPLQQVRNGVMINEIVCSEDRVQMVSPSGRSICVFEESVLELETRGFEYVGEPFDMFPIKSTGNNFASADKLGFPPVVSMSHVLG